METEVDVIIPTYKPKAEFLQLIERLEGQTVPVRRIILMNTEEKYFQRLVYGTDFQKKYHNVEIHHLSKREFDHGNTRNQGVKKSITPYFVCMTDDAVPEDDVLLEKLLAPFGEREDVAVSYARQLPREDAGPVERYTRQFNYPGQSCVKGREELASMGIKAFFCSNVCAAYRRDVFEEMGGFIRHTIFNEDMIYAGRAIQKGYQIAYAAEARVVHSHTYSAGEAFHRNFDLGVSQAEHPELFDGVRSESEGMKLVKETACYLKSQGEGRRVPGLILNSGCKYLGYRLGKKYRRLPLWLVKRCSMNKRYWNR